MENLSEKINEEIARLENNPEEMERVLEFQNNIGSIHNQVYAKVTRSVFHDFIQVCKNDGVTIGQRLSELVTIESQKDFKGKKPYDPTMDFKAMQARNFD